VLFGNLSFRLFIDPLPVLGGGTIVLAMSGSDPGGPKCGRDNIITATTCFGCKYKF